MSSQAVAKVDAHGVSQADAAGGEIERTAEQGTAALEAQARAMVQARLFVAIQRPRSWDQVEQKLRKECIRPGFANSAWWVLPLGNDPKKYPKGLSIRFAEAALRMAGNIDVQVQTVFDDAWKRIVRITVLDLEANFAYTTEATVDKAVERANATGREVLSIRQNSQGRVTYLVTATEQEVALKQGSAISKAIRTNGLRLIPGDILDECRALIVDTRAKGAEAEDPEKARKAILDSFAEVGVMPADLAKYLEHDTGIFQPAEREVLRGIYQAIRDGNATWRDVLEAKFGPQEGNEESEAARKLKEKLAKKAHPAATPAQAVAAQPPAKSETPAASETPTAGRPAGSDAPSVVFETTDWPDNPPTDRPFVWKGDTYQAVDEEGGITFKKIASAPTPEPSQRPVFGKKH